MEENKNYLEHFAETGKTFHQYFKTFTEVKDNEVYTYSGKYMIVDGTPFSTFHLSVTRKVGTLDVVPDEDTDIYADTLFLDTKNPLDDTHVEETLDLLLRRYKEFRLHEKRVKEELL